MDRGNYKEAAEVLQAELTAGASDGKRRLLAKCMAGLRDYAGALDQMAQLEHFEPFDVLYKGWLLHNKEDIEGARDCFRRYVALKPNCPDGHYWLGRAYDHWKFHDDESRRLAVESFRKAIACDGCRADAYVLLAQRLPWDDEGGRERLRILTDALAKHPESEDVRLDLSSLHLHLLKHAQQGLDVLKPLLDQAKPNSRALWRAYLASKDMQRYQDAKRFLVAIPSEHLEGVLREQVLGDLELLSGEYQDALRTFSAAKDAAAPHTQPLLHFGRADAMLSSGNVGAAIDEARHAAFSLLELTDEDLNYDDPISVDGEPQGFAAERSLVAVCTRLLADDSDFVRNSLDNDLRGALTYALYKGTRTGEGTSDKLLLAAAKLLKHPAMSYDLECYSFHTRDFAAGIRHHLATCRWKRRKGSTPADIREYDATIYLEQEECPRTKEECRTVLKTFLKELKACRDSEEITTIFVPTYTFVRDCIRTKEMYGELLEPASILLEQASDAVDILWDRTYALHCQDNNKEAEDGYRRLLAINPDDVSSLHNLSLLVHARGDIEGALTLSQKAASLSPSSGNITNWHSKLQSRKAEQDKEKERREDFLRTAVQRWPKLDYYKRQLVCTLSLISGWQGLDHLAKLSGCDERFLPGHLRALEEEGMILYPTPDVFEVNRYILPLIERENTHAVITKIIHGDDGIAFRPIFNSKQEYTVYNILISLFPNHLVFPNMALQTVFQYARMKELLEKDVFSFFLNSQVDVCITSTANYLPLIAFEVDSRFHDDEDQKGRDAKKDKVFALGGVSLVRLRGYGRPTEMALRNQIVQEVISLGHVIRKTTQKSAVLSTLEREVDFDSFGAQAEQCESRRWITVSQAASVSGANPGVITRAVDAGELMGNGMTGRERRVDAVDLTQWMLQRIAKPEAEESDAQVERLVGKYVTD
jgi:tetratricopeptide (TPR) repeat protein